MELLLWRMAVAMGRFSACAEAVLLLTLAADWLGWLR
jgi:hypothetical protein